MRFAANAAPWHVKCVEPLCVVINANVHCVSLLGEGRAGPHWYVPYIVFLDLLVCLITVIHAPCHRSRVSCSAWRLACIHDFYSKNCKSEHLHLKKSPAALRGPRLAFGSSRPVGGQTRLRLVAAGLAFGSSRSIPIQLQTLSD